MLIKMANSNKIQTKTIVWILWVMISTHKTIMTNKVYWVEVIILLIMMKQGSPLSTVKTISSITQLMGQWVTMLTKLENLLTELWTSKTSSIDRVATSLIISTLKSVLLLLTATLSMISMRKLKITLTMTKVLSAQSVQQMKEIWIYFLAEIILINSKLFKWLRKWHRIYKLKKQQKKKAKNNKLLNGKDVKTA